MLKLALPLAALALLTSISTAAARNCKVVQLEGAAEILQQNQWLALGLGDILSDTSPVRTLANSKLDFACELATIRLGQNTQIAIIDRMETHYTTIEQKFGTIAVAAASADRNRFEVATPFLTAVFKDAVLGVSSDSKSSTVSVKDGVVDVSDKVSARVAELHAGESARAGAKQSMTSGILPNGKQMDDAKAALENLGAPELNDAAPKDAAIIIDPVKDLAKAGMAVTPQAGGGAPDSKKTTVVISGLVPSAANLSSSPNVTFELGRSDQGTGNAKVTAAEPSASNSTAEGEDAKTEPAPAAKVPSPTKKPHTHAFDRSGKDKKKHGSAKKAAAVSADGTSTSVDDDDDDDAFASELLPLIFDLEGTPAICTWLGIGVAFFVIGWGVSSIIGEVGFGAALNGLIVFCGAFAGAFLRDKFMFDENWFAWEPYVSIFSIVVVGLGTLVAACLLKHRHMNPSDPKGRKGLDRRKLLGARARGAEA